MDGYVREKDDAKEAPERRIARKLDADPRDKVVNQTFQDEDIIPSYLLWNWGLFFGGAGGAAVLGGGAPCRTRCLIWHKTSSGQDQDCWSCMGPRRPAWRPPRSTCRSTVCFSEAYRIRG